MSAGVGGRTVEEAKWRLTYVETLDWQQYMQRRGSLNLGMRMEAGFALIAYLINRALGGKAQVTDYMPHSDAPGGTVVLKEATIEDAMRELTRAAYATKASNVSPKTVSRK